MHRVAVMQGRLLPPVGSKIQAFPAERWADEFANAAAAGIDGIEWIYDAPDAEANPLASTAGRAQICTLSVAHGVGVWSCCADYFMARPLARGDAREEAGRRLHELIGWAADLEIGHLVLPFVDASALHGPGDIDSAVAVLSAVAPMALAAGVELHLETDLPPASFAGLLDRLPWPAVRANYDSGNSASLGYAPGEEFAAYGERVGSVHLKDRVRGGGTVPPGTGNTDFSALFEALARANYRGDFTLQVARGTSGDEVAWLAKQRAFFEPGLRALSEAVA